MLDEEKAPRQANNNASCSTSISATGTYSLKKKSFGGTQQRVSFVFDSSSNEYSAQPFRRGVTSLRTALKGLSCEFIPSPRVPLECDDISEPFNTPLQKFGTGATPVTAELTLLSGLKRNQNHDDNCDQPPQAQPLPQTPQNPSAHVVPTSSPPHVSRRCERRVSPCLRRARNSTHNSFSSCYTSRHNNNYRRTPLSRHTSVFDDDDISSRTREEHTTTRNNARTLLHVDNSMSFCLPPSIVEVVV